MAYFDYKIAASNNNAAGLLNVETITATGDTKPFKYPQSLGTYDPGIRETKQDGLDSFSGTDTLAWLWYLTRNQYSYLISTYCGGSFSGLVTIRTRTTGSTYANYNAVMHLPTPAELGLGKQKQRKWMDVLVTFSEVEAL